MAKPTLLLSPSLSRDRTGTIAPAVDPNATVVAGGWGAQAWRSTSAGIVAALSTAPTYWHPTRDTLLVRYRVPSTPTGHVSIISGVAPTPQVFHYTNNRVRIAFNAVGVDQVVVPNPNAWSTAAMVVTDTTVRAYWNGVHIGSAQRSGAMTLGGDMNIGYASPSGIERLIESVALFDVVLSDTEIRRLSTMPAGWTWQNLHSNGAVMIRDDAHVMPIPVMM